MKKVLTLVMVLCLGFVWLTDGASGFTIIGFEAEAGINGATWIRGDITGTEWIGPYFDAGASGSLYLGTVNGNGDNNGTPPAAGSDNDGMSGYKFHAPAGTYKILVRAALDDSNSMWFRIVDSAGNPVADTVVNSGTAGAETWVRWDGIKVAPNRWWTWDAVHSADDGGRDARFVLPVEGDYEVQVARREDGVRFDGFVITDALGLSDESMPNYIPHLAAAVSPADRSTGVALSGTVLSWPAKDGASYDVVFGTDAAQVANPASARIGTVVGASGTASLAIASPLVENTTYYWRVDEVAEPNKLVGMWSLKSFNSAPIIVSQPAARINIGVGCAAVLQVAAISGSDDAQGALTYQWYDGAGAIGGATATSYSAGTEGIYYCVVSNLANGKSAASGNVVVNVAPRNEFAFEVKDIADTEYRDMWLTGSASYDPVAGTYTVIAAGRDIWNNEDEFTYLYTPLRGDGVFQVRVVSIDNPGMGGNTGKNGWIKAGLMVRETLSNGSRSANEILSDANGTRLQRRENTGEGSASGGPAAPRAPYWLRLQRAGNVFRGYSAPDVAGVPGAWVQDDADRTINMSAPIVYVGLAVTSHDNNRYARAVFDNLSGIGTSWVVTPLSPDPTAAVDTANPVILSWLPAALGPCGATYEVFLGPNAGALASVGTTGDTQVDVSSFVAAGSQYSWRVDTKLGVDTETGIVQSFSTGPKLPVRVSGPAPWAMGDVGEQVTFEYVASSPGGEAVSYAWYKGIGDPNDVQVGAAGRLTVTIGPATTGSYLCKASNVHGSTTSSMSNVGVKAAISRWTMDAKMPDPNAVVVDSIGGHDGALYGDPNLAPGVSGLPGDNALLMDGVDDYVVVGSVGISGNMPRSITCWAKNSVPGITDWTNIFGFTSTDAVYPNRTANSFDFDKRGGADQYCIHRYGGEWNMGAIDGLWHFLAASYDGATIRYYFDGRYVGQVNDALQTQDNVQMGRRGHAAGGFWPGLVDDARIYNYAIDPIAIGVLYTDVVAGSSICAGLTADYNGDCRVTLADFAIWAENWGVCGVIPDCQ